MAYDPRQYSVTGRFSRGPETQLYGGRLVDHTAQLANADFAKIERRIMAHYTGDDMQLFAVSDDPVECAQALDDLRLNKMVLETAQLLCNAVRPIASRKIQEVLYRPTHERHPCSLWLQADKRNLSWGIELFVALHNEWEHRRQTTAGHLSWIKLADVFAHFYAVLPRPTSFVNCSLYQQDDIDVFMAYKMTLVHKWHEDEQAGRPPKWTNRGVPLWRLR